MRTIAFAAAVTLAATSAFADAKTEARDLAIAAFANIDANSNGFVDRQEFLLSAPNFFVSIDSDDSGAISLEELKGWDFGFANIAQASGREAALAAALKTSFVFLDANGNGDVSKGEWRLLQSDGFFRSDLNNDTVLTAEEFADGFPLMVAIQAAFE